MCCKFTEMDIQGMFEKIEKTIKKLGYNTCSYKVKISDLSEANKIVATKKSIFSQTTICIITVDDVDEKSINDSIKYFDSQDELCIFVLKMREYSKIDGFAYLSSTGNIAHFVYIQPNGNIETDKSKMHYYQSKKIYSVISEIKRELENT